MKMNLYLVLALALGAATPAPMMSPTATVITARGERAAVCGPASAGWVLRTGRSAGATQLWHGHSCPCGTGVLTGAASPRAPAFSC
ncbi:MAG TPA: hypothetical protein VER58_18715 [Thermoanaerobaculia bacterium]|nr:hypothetical protein [Thermoanaerobaculia bacterium]